MKEKIHCLRIEPGKAPEACELINELAALQEAVGGLIELLDMEEIGNGEYVTMLCNVELIVMRSAKAKCPRIRAFC